MATLPVRVGGGWLLACMPCGWEQFASSRTAAERAARDHDRSRHPAVAAPETSGVPAGLFDLEETR